MIKPPPLGRDIDFLTAELNEDYMRNVPKTTVNIGAQNAY